MTSSTPETAWYRNRVEGTVHEVVVGSATHDRLLTEIRDDADPLARLAYLRGDKSKAGRVLVYRRLTEAEVAELTAC